MGASNAIFPPYLKGRIPQHGRGGNSGFGDEFFGLIEVVSAAHTDYLDLIGVVLSELLNVRRFAPTSRSMRCPEPQQHRPVSDDSARQSSG